MGIFTKRVSHLVLTFSDRKKRRKSTEMDQVSDDISTQGGGHVLSNVNDQQKKQFANKVSKILGVLQIVLGIATLFCYISPIVYSHLAYNSPNYQFDIAHVPAFLSGIAYIIAGILGIVASRCSTTSNITIFLVLNIIALPFASFQLTTSLAAVVVFLQFPVAVGYIIIFVPLAIMHQCLHRGSPQHR